MALVNKMQKQAARVTDAAQAESQVALDSLKQISELEKTLTTAAPQVLRKCDDGITRPAGVSYKHYMAKAFYLTS